ncbi:MAG: DUF192 domain-containing protein [Candidatus Micrarchaeota archaeon]|nr:DUF192 domain-containing protein [Candidatus Micrarchaeota archaeon]
MPGKKRAGPDWPLLPIIVFATAAVLVFLYANFPFHPNSQPPNGGTAIVRIGGYSYNVLLALNEQEWKTGLMNYTFSCSEPGLCNNGMLFVFPYNGSQCFWMKDTTEPLYQVWISGNVVTSFYKATPESTNSVCSYGDKVLELYSKLPLNLSIGENVSLGKVTQP